ncbi:hypothetical protein ACFQXA_37970 [Nocardiopsis composta]
MSIQRIETAYWVGELFGVFIEQYETRAAHTPRGPDALDDDMTIEALPTWYAGTTFRSALEADWAATLDTFDIDWEYEPRAFTLPSGATYLPDFHLPRIRIWLEVKGTGVPRAEKAAELAGMLACRCTGPCGCETPGGEAVIVGHSPKPYTPGADFHDAIDELGYANAERRIRKHPGHPVWSSADGRSSWMGRCPHCGTAGWSLPGEADCRSCGRQWNNAWAYRPGRVG